MRHRIKKYWIMLLVCFMHVASLSAQSNLSFDHLAVEDGLSQSTVLAITQDAQGFIWFGTRDGLNRYDARKINAYRHDPADKGSLSDNLIYCLLPDQSDRFWIGTRAGLNLFDAKTDSFIKFFSDSSRQNTLSNNTVTCMLQDRSKNIWVGTRKGLNLLIENDTISFRRFVHDPSNVNSIPNDDVRSIFQDKEGAIWVGTTDGFAKLIYKNENDFSFTSFRLPGVRGYTVKTNWVNAFAEDDAGRLLIGAERNGLTFFDKTNLKFSDQRIDNTGLEAKAVRSILKDPEGKFWIGTIGGLFIVNNDFSKITSLKNVPDNASTISDNSIRSLYLDRHGSFWIGTFHGGVNIYSAMSKQFHHLKPDADGQKLSFKVASALTKDKSQNFWIGTEGNGLFFLDRKSNLKMRFKHDENNINSLCHDNIKSLLLEEGRGIWIGTIKGLDFYDFRTKHFDHFRIDPGNSNFSLPDDIIYDMVKDEKGNLWVALYRGGLLRLNAQRGTVEEFFTYDPENEKSLDSEGATRLFIDSKQNLWVGTMSGLNKKMPDGTFARFASDLVNTNSLLTGYITCLYEDKKNQLWVGTRGAGLKLLSEKGKMIMQLTTDNDLPGNSVYAIEEDKKGYLWLSTDNGLSRLDPGTLQFKNFNRSDGLVCKEFNFHSNYKDDAGYFYFGGYNGIVYFHPDSISENKVVPSLALTDIKLFNKDIKPGDPHGLLENHINYQEELEFRHDQNIFSVEFAVLNYINAKKNQFAYKLEGFEEDWNIVKEPVATYMNLAPGHYTLLVKGSNNDGIWSDKPKALAIHVLPPPWKTWWAYVAYVTTFLLLLYAWSRLYRKRVKLEHDLQLEHLEKIKQEEFHQAKLNFFTNIAHEIRTPVTLMVGPIEHLLDTHSHDVKLKKELSLVKNNTDRLMRLLTQLLDFQKHETGNVKLRVSRSNIVSFTREMLDSFREYADARKVSLKFSTTAPVIPLWFDADEMSKVFFNVLVNALKFTPGGGEVSIAVSRIGDVDKQSSIKIIIEDNGLGISAAHLEKIFHRFYQAENTGIQEAGYGIGLALTKGIIDLHHGSIAVESREANNKDSGFTRFTILLRGDCAHFSEDQLLSEPEPKVQDMTASSIDEDCDQKTESDEKPLILLVEDNDEIRMYMRDILISHYEVLESSNGYEGWDIAIERLPNLIVSDVMMPRMNGIELVKRLKADPRTNHIPVILLTARATLNHQVEGLETGADDYLTKPFHNNLLLVKIKNHLAIREKLKEKYSRIVTLQPRHEEVQDPDDRFLQRLMNILEENIADTEFNVSKLVREIGMSRPVLFRKTKMLTGLSVIDLIRNVRMKKAEMLLKQKKLSISEVAFTVGFSDPKYFSKSFRSQYGKPPSQYLEELGDQ